MAKKWILAALTGVILLSVFEVFFYFVFIFKPFDRLGGRELLTPQGIPSTSELFSPIKDGNNLNLGDDLKTFFADRLGDFKNIFAPIVSENSTFVKKAEAAYSIAGFVDEIKSVNNPSGFAITLSNSTSKKYTIFIKDQEAQNAHVSALASSGNGFSRTEKSVADITKGDYVTIKKSFNLLNPEEINLEIEIIKNLK